ncbi:Cro/CI family transcriptional regulator [Pseudomonas syringae pv. maculicola]|uniref:helix-turn-helix domain-containing protein n=1 Tax=Pseudomonas syringae group genomosp. 3 TaxID=251701 RepID=UPI000F00902F|nr:helix-turn-helix transcriptional regulator [Pseudomonas syringae group genomosp. 3]RMO81779.1 Cro/CI family transcriptional regulator [Pseudomonas syringae pv. maculicola]
MSKRAGLAAALRAVRAIRGLAQSDLGEAADRKFVYRIEQGKSDMTVGKFDEIAAAVGMNPITLMVLGAVSSSDQTARDVLQAVQAELDAFETEGGFDALARQFEDGAMGSRTHERQKRLEVVQRCKAMGMTQREAAQHLKIAKSTVADLWNS